MDRVGAACRIRRRDTHSVNAFTSLKAVGDKGNSTLEQADVYGRFVS